MTQGSDKPAPASGKGRERKTALPKRFYKEVAIEDRGADGIAIALLLDGKPVRTPGKAPLVLPARDLAAAVAEEWRAQGERIDPETMPLTRLANSAIDGVRGREDAVIADILAHAGSDLLCYRADGPKGLVAAQSKHWDPVLAWAKSTLKAPLRLAEGIVHVAQPKSALQGIKRELEGLDAFRLAALHGMTSLTGSALLALAVALQRLTPEEAWKAAHVDEAWEISQWGEDEDAAARRANRWRDFAAASRMLKLLTEA
ncbi:MAG TPA: ATP12 family protein [Methyloceanibacter sp.]|nr:ATP12 family protein [Methyloceanibacter sp.]